MQGPYRDPSPPEPARRSLRRKILGALVRPVPLVLGVLFLASIPAAAVLGSYLEGRDAERLERRRTAAVVAERAECARACKDIGAEFVRVGGLGCFCRVGVMAFRIGGE